MRISDVDLSGLDTSAVRNMSFMFLGCSSLASLDLSSFDMFGGCPSLASITVGDGYDFKSADVMPGDDGDDSWQSADGSWLSKDEIVRTRSHAADTYCAGPLRERFVSVMPMLSGRIGLTFYADLSNLTEQERALSYVTFIIGGRGATALHVDYDPSFMDPTGRYHGFNCPVNSLEMADTVTATLHFPHENRQYTREKRTSVKDSLLNAFGLVPAKYDTLLRAIVDYGYHAQRFLADANDLSIGDGAGQYAPMDKRYTSSYDRARLESATQPFAPETDVASDVKKVSAAIVLGSGADLRLFLWQKDDATGDVPTATIDGKPAEVIEGEGAWSVTIQDLAVQDLDKEHTVCFHTAGGLTTVKMSGLSYAHGVFAKTDDVDQLAVNAMGALYDYYQCMTVVNRI